MMDFWHTIKSSFFDPVFYNTIRTQPLRPGIKILSILGLVGVGLPMIFALGGLIAFAFSDSLRVVESLYPSELVITIADGEMSINQPQPYYVKNSLTTKPEPKYLVIFDGDDQISGDGQENSTMILVKKKFAMTGGSDSQGRVISFSNLEGTTTIEKSTVVNLIEKIRPYFAPVVLIGGIIALVAGTVFAVFFWVLFHMIYILFPSVLIFLFSLMRGSHMTYTESYKIGLYASIPIAIFSYLCSHLGFPLPAFAYSLILLLIAVVNISHDVKR